MISYLITLWVILWALFTTALLLSAYLIIIVEGEVILNESNLWVLYGETAAYLAAFTALVICAVKWWRKEPK